MIKFLTVYSHQHNYLFCLQQVWYIICHTIGYIIINSCVLSCMIVMLMLFQKMYTKVHSFNSLNKSNLINHPSVLSNKRNITSYVAWFISSFVAEGGGTLTYVYQTSKSSILPNSTHCLINFLSTYIFVFILAQQPQSSAHRRGLCLTTHNTHNRHP